MKKLGKVFFSAVAAGLLIGDAGEHTSVKTQEAPPSVEPEPKITQPVIAQIAQPVIPKLNTNIMFVVYEEPNKSLVDSAINTIFEKSVDTNDFIVWNPSGFYFIFESSGAVHVAAVSAYNTTDMNYTGMNRVAVGSWSDEDFGLTNMHNAVMKEDVISEVNKMYNKDPSTPLAVIVQAIYPQVVKPTAHGVTINREGMRAFKIPQTSYSFVIDGNYYTPKRTPTQIAWESYRSLILPTENAEATLQNLEKPTLRAGF